MPPQIMWSLSCRLVLVFYVVQGAVETLGTLVDESTFKWEHGQSAEKTYLFTNVHRWESLDHQMTSVVSLLTLAKNTTSIAVLPYMPSSSYSATKKSLLGDYFDLSKVKEVQEALTLSEFLDSSDYEVLKNESSGTVPFPKDSHEEYEGSLHLFGKLLDTVVSLPMPAIDPEHTNQKCSSFAGTMHLSSDGLRRYVFLDRIHFMHFCFEKFMPWWYDVRHHIAPRQQYLDAAELYLSGKRSPRTTVHISDLMDSQKRRDEEEIERYARQIVDALRKHQAIGGSMYLVHPKGTKNVQRVVNLLQQEFEGVANCTQFFSCGREVPRDLFDPALSEEEHKSLFGGPVGLKMLHWAIGSSSEVFVGNVHSPFSRNVCLQRKTHGKTYAVLKGFGEIRKIWSWNL